jgi:hypothetical protein
MGRPRPRVSPDAFAKLTSEPEDEMGPDKGRACAGRTG